MSKIPTPAQLITLNNRFYQDVFIHFSASRQNFSPGWLKFTYPPTPRILDLAAGNLRFKAYLDQHHLPYQAYLAVDSCLSLLQQSHQDPQFYQVLDILHSLTTRQNWTNSFQTFAPNFILISNFLHHVPTASLRTQLITTCLQLLPPSGILAVSLWQFALEKNWRRRLIKDLGHHDYLISWDKQKQIPRFCHHFSNQEITNLIAQLSSPTTKLIANYPADSKSDRANRWLLWRVI